MPESPTCLMCGKPLRWSRVRQQWEHDEGRTVYCTGKASVATLDTEQDND